MSPNELRIGNIIQDEIELETRLVVFKIEQGVITCGDAEFSHPYLIENIKPVPITGAILEQLGFELDEQGRCWTKDGADLHRDGKNLFYHINDTFHTHIDYIHVLQNWYFANTGEELKLTEHA